MGAKRKSGKGTAVAKAKPRRRVTAKQLGPLHRRLLSACEARVVRWEWATKDRWPPTPFHFERLQLKPGRLLKRPPKTPKRGTLACGLDDEGRIVVKRDYWDSGFSEVLFEPPGDVVDSYYFFVGRERCTATRHWYKKGRIVRLAHTYDSGEVNEQRFSWKSGCLVKVTARGAGHDFDDVLEHDEQGLLRVTRAYPGETGEQDVQYQRVVQEPTRQGRRLDKSKRPSTDSLNLEQHLERLQHRLNLAIETAAARGARIDSVLRSDPAAPKVLAKAAKGIGRPIPKVITDYLRVAAVLRGSWQLPDESEEILPPACREALWGGVNLSVEAVVAAETSRQGWVKSCFADREDSYDLVWHDKFAFQTVANGDCLAVADDEDGAVFYLSHDAGDEHGALLAESFAAFLDKWSLLGFVGPEGWVLSPFMRSDPAGLDEHGALAQQWRRAIGLETLAAT